ncbi:unnamed protein product, partial [Mesorhabditis belari]|uniref:Peptidase S1 domain-containing protein n=1 Tax=Mesorhabditis belari TaxID=2138241 RepID=A0AAF3F384_9BILA
MIVDGIQESSENSPNYHWAVGIFMDDPEVSITKCTGTLISPIHVVTAAHCVTNRGDNSTTFNRINYFVGAGAKCVESTQECRDFGAKRVIAKVKNVVATVEIMKGEWNRHGGDIALLELENPIEQNNHIEFACLPAHDMDLPLNTPNFIHWGWGKREFDGSPATKAAVLNYLKDVSLFDCAITNPDVDVMCTTAKLMKQGTEWGDSGSGLEYFEQDFATGKHYVVGVTDYSTNISSHTYCADLRIYSKWICDLTGICYMEKK